MIKALFIISTEVRRKKAKSTIHVTQRQSGWRSLADSSKRLSLKSGCGVIEKSETRKKINK